MELDLMVTAETREKPTHHDEDESLLVAALAALLIEYKRNTGQFAAQENLAHTSANWRRLGRWEQLQG